MCCVYGGIPMGNRNPTINTTQKTKEMNNRNPTINTTQKTKEMSNRNRSSSL
jgi:hypothetical protein